MQSLRSISPIVRAIGVIGAVAILVTSITYAALQSQATLTNNTIASATALLEVDNTDDAGSGFGGTDVGYAFTGIIPGGAGSNVGNFQLKNSSDTGVDMSVSVQVPTLPTWTVLPSGTVDDSKVTVDISCSDTDAIVYGVSDTLANINAAPVELTGDTLAAGDTATCTVSVSMDADAFSGTSASSDNFDFEFTGTNV